jgi:ferredoxin-NADP reductase
MGILPGRFTRHFSQWLIAAGIGLTAIMANAQAQTPPQATQEINSLLDFVEHSECRFVRNGSEYPGAQARAHLEKKLEYLEERDKVNSAEDFIELAATQSSMSGLAYEVRCPAGVQPASLWLKTELQRQRQRH